MQHSYFLRCLEWKLTTAVVSFFINPDFEQLISNVSVVSKKENGKQLSCNSLRFSSCDLVWWQFLYLASRWSTCLYSISHNCFNFTKFLKIFILQSCCVIPADDKNNILSHEERIILKSIEATVEVGVLLWKYCSQLKYLLTISLV